MNQWEILLEFGNGKDVSDAKLVLESAWKTPNWAAMKQSIQQVEGNFPKEEAWRLNLYRGYLAICSPDDPHLPMVERYVEQASTLCMKEWRRLPHIVSHIHLPFLQAAQQVMELQEAAQIHQGLTANTRNNSLHDMKVRYSPQSIVLGFVQPYVKVNLHLERLNDERSVEYVF